MARTIEREIKKDSFGWRLNEEIIKKYGSRNAFSKATGISREPLLMYVENRRHPNTAIFVEICNALNVSADYLLFGEKRDRNGI